MKKFFKQAYSFLTLACIVFWVLSTLTFGIVSTLYLCIRYWFALPEWAYDGMFYLTLGVIGYLFLRYRVTIDIKLNNKKVFSYENRGGKS